MSRPSLRWIPVISPLCVLLIWPPGPLEAQVGTPLYDFERSISGPFADATTLDLPPGGYRIRAEVAVDGGGSFGCGVGGADAALTFSLQSSGSPPIAERAERMVESGEDGGLFCGNYGYDWTPLLGPWSVNLPLSASTAASQDSDVGSTLSGTLTGSAGESVPSCGSSTTEWTFSWITYEADFTLLTTTTLALDLSGSIDITGASCPGSAYVVLSVIEAEVACGNGLDDDGDGLTDCDDPDCSVACIEDCSDGIDNDLDGSIDCADEDCAPLSVCDESFFCDDGVDNDVDGLIDCADPDCASETPCVIQFVRGDANTDGVVDVADPVVSLSYLFSNGTVLCLAAQDANDDGAIDIGDPIYALTYLFSGGPPPQAPFPSCGLDPDPISLGCAQFDLCP